MADLILKFFREDLTEAEQQALSDSILSSEEEAMRLTEEAAKAYQRYGLPEPQWAGGGPPKTHWPNPGWNTWSWFSAILTGALVTWSIWHFRAEVEKAVSFSLGSGQNSPSTPTMFPKAPTSTISQKGSSRADPFNKTAGLSPVKKSRMNFLGKTDIDIVVASAPVRAEKGPSTNPFIPSSRVTPVLNPVEVTANPHQAHSNLSVMVRRAEPGQVTLRLFDMDDNQVLLLYQGLLQTGNWVFDWDGKLEGTSAPPGYYQIQVESGPVTQKKKIFIR